MIIGANAKTRSSGRNGISFVEELARTAAAHSVETRNQKREATNGSVA